MITLRHYLILFPLAYWLTGCATLPSTQAPANTDMPWTKRAQDLSALDHWNIDAAVAIRAKDEANTASLHWQQNKQDYSLLLLGPLGAGAYKLSGQPGRVALENPQGKIFYAGSPEILLAEQTGWRLPVSNLYYWIRGLPVPGVAAQKQFDVYHHLTELDQQDWKIHYLRYTSVNGLDLPSKIFLDSSSLNLKIIISQWQ